jgi:hypothetical protein
MMRALWIALMILLGCVAFGTEMDRASRRQPALATLVPEPFRAFAQENLTMVNVRSADPDRALAEARTLVTRSPMPAEHLTLLAIALERQGNREGSALLVQHAARRGWRDPIAQQAMFDIALAANDPVEASHRFAALFALREQQAPLLDMRNRLLARPEGRATLAEALAAGGRWTKAFLQGTMGEMDDATAAVIVDALRRGARFDCAVTPQLKKVFIRRGLVAEAALIRECERD